MNKLPLMFSLLDHFSGGKEASYIETMDALKSEYGSERQFTKENFINHLIVMKENGLLDETKLELDKNDELVIYYEINDEGKSLLEKNLPKRKKLVE